MRTFIRVCVGCVFALSLVGSTGAQDPAPEQDVVGDATDARPRTILLAFDGLDHGLTLEFMQAGVLPNLARLSGLHGLTPCQPAQSPATWAVLNTGCNPGKTGVPGFVSRRFMQGRPIPQPMLGFPTEIEMELDGVVRSVPYTISPMQATHWWAHLDRIGVRTMGIQVGATSPPDREGPHTRLLSGRRDPRGAP